MVRLSTDAGTRSLYFHQNSITPDGRFVIAEGTAGIVAIEIATRKNTLIVPGKVRALFVGRKSGLVYFSRSEGAGNSEQQTPTSIFTVPATGGKPRRIAQIERGFIGSVNADETLLLGVYAERAWQLEQGPRDPRFDANYAATGKDGKPLTFAEAKEVRLLQREQARIPMAMFTVNTATGEQTIIHRSTDWLNHLQFSPTDPKALMFCHEGPWHRVDRIWSMRLGDRAEDRSSPHDEHGNRRSRVLRRGRQDHLVRPADAARRSVLAGGRRTRWQRGAGTTWIATTGRSISTSRPTANCSPATAVTRKWSRTPRMGSGCTCSRRRQSPTSPESRRRTPTTWCIRERCCAERLVDMKTHDYRLEPNIIFTRDGKWLIFRSNMHGDVHTYMVEVARHAK